MKTMRAVKAIENDPLFVELDDEMRKLGLGYLVDMEDV